MKIYEVKYWTENGKHVDWFDSKEIANRWLKILNMEDARLVDHYIGSGRAGLVAWLNTYFKGDI